MEIIQVHKLINQYVVKLCVINFLFYQQLKKVNIVIFDHEMGFVRIEFAIFCLNVWAVCESWAWTFDKFIITLITLFTIL